MLVIAQMSSVLYGFDGNPSYEVIVTNMTRGQTFTPILVITHKEGVKLFTPGSSSRPELAMLAEGGATDPLAERMSMNPEVGYLRTSGEPLGPGETTTIALPAGGMCGGEGFNEEEGEGYVHIHAGVHGIGDLDAAEYDWRNPVARIVIQRGSGH